MRDAQALGEVVVRSTELLGATRAVWSSRGDRAAGWVEGELRVWDRGQASLLHAFAGVEPDAITWSPDGADLYTFRRHEVRATEWCRYDLSRGERSWCVEAPSWVRRHSHVDGGIVYCDPISCFVLSRDGVVTPGLMNWSTDSDQRPSVKAMNSVGRGAFVYAGAEAEVWVREGAHGPSRQLDVSFPAVSRIEPVRGGFAIGGWEGALERWELDTRTRTWHAEVGAGVTAIEETADGATWAVSRMDGGVVLLDAATGAVTRALKGPTREATELAISVDGA